MVGTRSYDFSFSGLKSAVINTVHNAKQRGEKIAPEDLAASFQASVIDVLVTKAARAAEAYDVKQVLLAGGVAANKGLSARLRGRLLQKKKKSSSLFHRYLYAQIMQQ